MFSKQAVERLLAGLSRGPTDRVATMKATLKVIRACIVDGHNATDDGFRKELRRFVMSLLLQL